MIEWFEKFRVVTDPIRSNAAVDFVAEPTNAFNYSWDFGDGTTSNGRANTTHVYLETGEFTVTLFVAGDGGTDETSMTIQVVDPLPRAEFLVSPRDSVIAGSTEVTFENRTEFADTYLWDFGDGTTSQEREPTHVFQDVGVQSVTLTATNSEGTDTATRSLRTFLDPATPIFVTEIVKRREPDGATTPSGQSRRVFG